MIAPGMAQSAPLTDREKEIVRLVSRCRIEVALAIMAHFEEQAETARTEPPAPRPRRVKPGGLSARQKKIAEMVSQGLPNKQIAEKLRITEQTVKNHLYSVYNKLGISTRRELITALSESDLPDPAPRE